MPNRSPYKLLFIPLVLAYFAIAGFGFFFKAAVPGSCALILLFIFRQDKNSVRHLVCCCCSTFFHCGRLVPVQ